jgi:hypothetical protein
MLIYEREGVPTRMQALAPDVDENAMRAMGQKVVDCPFDGILAVLIFVDGNHGGVNVFFQGR